MNEFEKCIDEWAERCREAQAECRRIEVLYAQLQATLAAREARCKEVEEWQKIVIGSGTDQETVIRMAASEYTKTAVQCWKDTVEQLQATLAAREEQLRLANIDQANTEAALNDARQDAARLRKALEYCHAYFTGHLRPENNSPLAVIEAALKGA